MTSSDSINQGIEEFGLVADAQSLAARLSGAKSSAEAKAVQGQLLGLAKIAGNSSVALSEIMKALSGASGKILQLNSEEQDATYQRIMANRFLDADTKNLYDGVARFMTDEEKKYLDDIDPQKEYDVATFDENGNVNGSKKVLGYKLQESFILLKANANKGALSSSQLESLNRKLYDNPNGPQGINDIIKGEGRLLEAADLFRGHLKANSADVSAAREQSGAIANLMSNLVPAAGARMSTPMDNTFGSLRDTVHMGGYRTAEWIGEESRSKQVTLATVVASQDILKQVEQPAAKPRSADELRAAFDAIVDNGDRLMRSTDIITPEMVAAKTKVTTLPLAAVGASNATAKPAAANTGTPLPAAPAPGVVTPDSKTLVAGFKASKAETPPPADAAVSKPAAPAGTTLVPPAQQSVVKAPDNMQLAAARQEESKRQALVATQRATAILDEAKAVTDGKSKGNMAALFAELVDVVDKTKYDASSIAMTVSSDNITAGFTALPPKAPLAATSTPLPASPATMPTPPAASGAVDAGTITPPPVSVAAPSQPATSTPLVAVPRNTPSAAR